MIDFQGETKLKNLPEVSDMLLITWATVITNSA